MDMAYVCDSLSIPFKWVKIPNLPYLWTKEDADDDWKRLHDYQVRLAVTRA